MNWYVARDLLNQRVRDTFGEAVTFHRTATNTDVSIAGVWEMAWLDLTGADGVPTSGLHPTLAVRLADLAADPAAGDQVVRSGVTYDVIECRKDSGGGAVLVLHVT